AKRSVVASLQALVSRFPFDVGTVVVVFGPLLFLAAYECYRWRKRRLILRMQTERRPPPSWPIHLESGAGSVYDSPQITTAAHRLHSRQAAESYHLDLGATVEATAASLGYPLLRYRPDTRLSEYVVLIDRLSAHDHQAALFTQL